MQDDASIGAGIQAETPPDKTGLAAAGLTRTGPAGRAALPDANSRPIGAASRPMVKPELRKRTSDDLYRAWAFKP